LKEKIRTFKGRYRGGPVEGGQGGQGSCRYLQRRPDSIEGETKGADPTRERKRKRWEVRGTGRGASFIKGTEEKKKGEEEENPTQHPEA